MFQKIFSHFQKRKYLNFITINKEKIQKNISYLQSLQSGIQLFPVVKSNAYGHGLKEICSIFESTNIDMLCVDSYLEYQIVYKKSSKKILLLGETFPENYKNFCFHRTQFAIYNISTLRYLISLNKKIKIHIFLNTGMNREWLQQEELEKFLFLLKRSKVVVEWVMSHFASADESDISFSQKQILTFKKMYTNIEQAGFSVKYRHISASSGVLKIRDPFFNAARPGIASYGYNPLWKDDSFFEVWEKLQPALQVYSTITAIQKIKKWNWVSYNLTHIFEKDTCVWIMPFGYYEWLDRRESNNFIVKNKDTHFPLVWRVCMNVSCVNIWTSWMQVWDRVQLISENSGDKNSIKKVAHRRATIDYEVLIKLHEKIYREVI